MRRSTRRQYAALPYRTHASGRIEVMLVTSRKTRRWIIPKGWPVHGLAPGESAAKEAMEEAGLVGRIAQRPLGAYRYEKQLGGDLIPCEVVVFALEAKDQLASWPEKGQRRTKWFGVQEAVEAVNEAELGSIIRNLSDRSRRGSAH